MSPDNLNDIEGHVAEALEFLKRGRDYLAAEDLHQASVKVWGAAAQVAKAVALAQRWQYERHSHFPRIINWAVRLSDSYRLPSLHDRAEILYANLYELGARSGRRSSPGGPEQHSGATVFAGTLD